MRSVTLPYNLNKTDDKNCQVYSCLVAYMNVVFC